MIFPKQGSKKGTVVTNCRDVETFLLQHSSVLSVLNTADQLVDDAPIKSTLALSGQLILKWIVWLECTVWGGWHFQHWYQLQCKLCLG